MHRMTLLIETPSIFWDRNLPESLLFEMTLNKNNVEETDTFLTILDSEADFYKTECYKISKDMISIAQQLLTNPNPNSFIEGMIVINFIIVRTPKDSPVLATALKIRGNYYYHDCSFERASRDYEMYLEVYKILKSTNEEVCEVYGYLVICMYMMRKLQKTKKYFRSYKKYKAKLLLDALQKPSFVKIENYIGQFYNEIDIIENNAPKFVETQCKGIPYKGFTSSTDISAASTMCCFNSNSIYVKDDMPKSSVVFVEDPLMKSLNIPFLQCEVCYMQTQQVFTCLECRYKTYCSLCCMEKDFEAHRDECIGFKQLTLLILDASTIFRTFVKISIELHEHILNPQTFRKTRTAEEVWNKIEEILNKQPVSDFIELSLIKTKPNYFSLSEMQYSTIVATAFRLSMFIEKKTNLIERYYKRLNITNKQKLILIGSMLMRIHCNFLINTIDFEITKTTNGDRTESRNSRYMSIKQIEDMLKPLNRRQGYVESINKFYDIDVKKDIWQHSAKILNLCRSRTEIATSTLTNLRHTEPCNPINRVLSTFKDNIAGIYFNPDLMYSLLYGNAAGEPTTLETAKMLCNNIAIMTDIERCLFVKKFARLFHNHYTQYFFQMFDRDEKVQQILSLYCPTLRKLKHSCDPNIEVIVLDNGVVIGKALRKIKKGEQLYVSYKAHYMRHIRAERQKFLKLFDFNCQCNYCTMKAIEEPSNLRLGIFCESCKQVTITPNQGVCPICNTQYNYLFNKYRTVISILENELNNELSPCETTERDIYLLHSILYSYAKIYFVPQNEIQIAIGLKAAHFMALKNFAKQSYELIMEIRNNMKYHDERIMWFSFYADILLIIKIIIWNNLDEKFKSISTAILYELCSLGLYIAYGQKDYVEFNEIFDPECSYIFEDIKLFLQWKEIILCSDFSTVAKSLGSKAK